MSYAHDDADRLNSITQGAASVVFTYDDAGRLLSTTLPNGIIGTYAYDDATGRENDGALYLYRARYFHPTLGRFLSEDPLGFAAGDPNVYGYVGDNPTCRTDPSGRIVSGGHSLATDHHDRLGGRKRFETNNPHLGDPVFALWLLASR